MPQPRKHRDNAERQAAYRQRAASATQSCPANPPLPSLATRPGHHRWNALLNQAGSALTTVADEMREYYDARSQRWQESERGESLLERMEAVQELNASLEEVLES